MATILPMSAVIFLSCVLALLVLVILFLLYVRQIACCAKMPTPLCFAEMPRGEDMDDSDEELFVKYEDLMNNCPSAKDNLALAKSDDVKIAKINEEVYDAVDSGESVHPSLQIGLAYNSSNGVLEIRIIKGTYLHTKDCKNECYVKLNVCSDTGHQLGHVDTKKVVNEMHPTFDQVFKFEVPLFQVDDITAMISVYNKVSLMQKKMVGWLGFGAFNSAKNQMDHWKEMLNDCKGKEFTRWHPLMDQEFLSC